MNFLYQDWYFVGLGGEKILGVNVLNENTVRFILFNYNGYIIAYVIQGILSRWKIIMYQDVGLIF